MSLTATAPAEGAGARGSFLPITARRLTAVGPLPPEDIKILSSLRGRTFRAGSVVENTAETPLMLLSGWSARLISNAAGRKQIASILLPGDGFGLTARSWAGDCLPVQMLTDCVLVDAAPVRKIIASGTPEHIRLIGACHDSAALEQGYILDHVMRLGALDAHKRVAHFFVELYRRLEPVGLVRDDAFALPLKQQLLADVLGLSTVHFNRVIRKLKGAGLIVVQRGELAVPDIDKLAVLAEHENARAPSCRAPPSTVRGA